MSETGIEETKGYTPHHPTPIHTSPHPLVWVLVYAAAVAVVLLDLLVWRDY
jgi:hypothetical protein